MLVRTVFKGVIGVLTTLVMILGTTLLVQAINAYGSGETQDGIAFANLLLAISILSFPLSLFFCIKTVKTYRKHQSTYGLPEPPSRLFLLLSVSGALVLLNALTLTLYFVYIAST